jgi:hypothetical protein
LSSCCGCGCRCRVAVVVFVYPVHVQWGWGVQKGLHVPPHVFMLMHKVGWRVPKKRGSFSGRAREDCI